MCYSRRVPAAHTPGTSTRDPSSADAELVRAIGLVANTLVERPVQSLSRLGLLALGLPAYFYWRTN